MNDLLGLTVLATAGNAPPSSLLAPDSAGSLTNLAWTGYLTAAEKIAAEVMAGASKSKFIGCDPAVVTCLNDTIKAFGRKAFRRPLSDTEVTSFLRLNSLTPKGTPAEVAEAILYAFLLRRHSSRCRSWRRTRKGRPSSSPATNWRRGSRFCSGAPFRMIS